MAAKKGCFSRLLKVFLVLLAVLIILLITLFFLATGAPVSYPAPKFDGSDTFNITYRLARALVDKEGRPVETAVLHLKQDEVQTLLNDAIAKSIHPETQSLPYAVIWNTGRLSLHYSMPVSSGRAANISVEVSPVVDEGDLTLIPGQGAIGKVPMPRAALNYASKKLELMATGDDSTRTALSAFKRIEPGEDGTLLLMFDPRDVNTVVRILKSTGEDPRKASDEEDDGEEDDENAGRGDEDADEDADKNSGEIEERIEKNEE